MILSDRGERTSGMEPMLIGEGSRHRGPLVDLAVELAARSAGFRRSLPEGVRAALADLVRAMNCYYRGELPRAGVADVLGVTDRHARRIVAALAAHGVVASEGARAPLRLAFPAALASRWMPGLFPEKPG